MNDEKRLFQKLRNTEVDKERWKQFIAAHVRSVTVRPLLSAGCLTIHSQPELWNHTAHYGIYINSFLFPEGEQELMITLYHELVHVFFLVIGMGEHNEDEVETTAQLFAEKYPFILEVMHEIFPMLQFTSDFFKASEKRHVRALQNLPA